MVISSDDSEDEQSGVSAKAPAAKKAKKSTGEQYNGSKAFEISKCIR